MYDPELPKTDEEIELEEVVAGRLAYQLHDAREDSAEYKMIVRQMEGIRHGSELGRPAYGGIRLGRNICG